jgi:GH25 family lysozyme M1 (1,4-beta-N-acetylmuramidase)
MVYSSRRFALLKLNMSKLADFDFWFAEYKDGHNEPSYPYNFQIWQYASDGRVDGIEGEVDMNICFADYGREER